VADSPHFHRGVLGNRPMIGQQHPLRLAMGQSACFPWGKKTRLARSRLDLFAAIT
jgi:hypothetical protein